MAHAAKLKASAGARAYEVPQNLRSFNHLAPVRALALPLLFCLGLAAFGWIPSARTNPRLLWSFVGAAGLLTLWDAILLAVSMSRGRKLSLEIVLRKQHYLQACAQGSVLVYWGWYWRQVYDSAPLIAAQLVFAYAVDMLLTWSRRESYTLGFGPFPIIFSINLFLWFKQDWFYFQFLMIAAGLLAKEMIRWNKEGKPSHVFNPSSFPLGLASLILILTRSTDITWGREVATTLFNAPHIYLFIFLIGLPGQFLFGVTTMTMSAVTTTYLFSLLYYMATGTYYFIDAYIPIAVFLGMHLLFTDPSTSPRSELGRVMFGVMYGVSVIVLYRLLSVVGVPTFYDKLMAVPMLNLMIKGIDSLAKSDWLKRFDPARIATSLRGRQRHAAFISVWAMTFILISVANGVGDSHPGHFLRFWVQACAESLANACKTLSGIEDHYCADGSGWACNELGLMTAASATASKPPSSTVNAFARSCDAGFEPGCVNLRTIKAGQTPSSRTVPTVRDYFVILREGKGPLPDKTPLELYGRACRQGWIDGCQKACALGDSTACSVNQQR